MLLSESCLLKFSLIFLIIQKEKASNFLLRKLVGGTYCSQNMLCGGASPQPTVGSLLSPFIGSLPDQSSEHCDTCFPFSIGHGYLTCHFIFPNNVPGSDLTNDLFTMPWIVLRGTVGLWTHGGGRPEARDEISWCGFIIQYFGQQIPRVTKSSHENCYLH